MFANSPHAPFVLIRILGNDLPPRHSPGQTRRNLEFILRHESRWPELTKLWILNRIWDRDGEARIIDLLQSHGQVYQRSPFDLREYADQPFAYEPRTTCFLKEYRRMTRPRRARADLHARRHRANYAINNNGGRLAALYWGRQTSEWVLPWDGNCFLTDNGWAQIKQIVEANGHLPYFVVPMARVTDNRQLLDIGFCPKAAEEPQLIFRHDATEEFDPDRPYGRRPKVDLLWRLGVPGPWDEFEDDPWDPPRPAPSQETGQFAWAGWVARLDSGRDDLEKPTKGSRGRRSTARSTSILTALDKLDAEVVATTLPDGPVFIDEARLDVAAKAWAEGSGAFDQPAGIIMAEVGRTPTINRAFSSRQVVACTLAWHISGAEEHAEVAAKAFASSSFLFPFYQRLTGSTFHLRSGEALALLLDAVKMLGRGNFLTDVDLAGLRSYLTRALNRWTHRWLGTRHGRKASPSALLYDVRSAVVAAYLDRYADLAAILRRSNARLAWQFPPGERPPSIDITTLRAWLLLALLAERAGSGALAETFHRARYDLTSTARDSSAINQAVWSFTLLHPHLPDPPEIILDSEHA